jgi:hypothetical protein
MGINHPDWNSKVPGVWICFIEGEFENEILLQVSAEQEFIGINVPISSLELVPD